MSTSSNQVISLMSKILVVLFTITISLCFIIPKGNEVLWINGNHSPFQDVFFSMITLLGSTIVFFILIVAMIFIRFNYAILLGAVFFLNSVLVLFFKRVVFPDLERPLAWLDHSQLYFVNGIDTETLYSFPSGHTATAFAMAVALSLCLKNRGWSILLIGVALLIGYSRIYLLQHYLMDVVAGAFIGSVSGFIVYYLKPITIVQWFHKKLQTAFADDDSAFFLLPPFIAKSSRVRRWTERVLREAL